MLNAETKYRFQVALQIVYFTEHPDDPRVDFWFWARTSAFRSNFLLTDSFGITPGAVVRGLLAPTFGAVWRRKWNPGKFPLTTNGNFRGWVASRSLGNWPSTQSLLIIGPSWAAALSTLGDCDGILKPSV